MNNWQDYFEKTVVINLEKRIDRKKRMIEIFEQFDINGEIFIGTDLGNALGLVHSMQRLFYDCIEQKINNVLVFEDDCEILVGAEEFNLVMTKCVEDLKNIKWDCFYLGLQHPRIFTKWVTKNILPVNRGYSTHSVAYSSNAMQFFLDKNVHEPIDNFFVREFQGYNTSFCSYPLLTTQADTFSDIGQDKPDWNKYILNSYREAVKNILQFR